MNALGTGMFHRKGPFGGPRWSADFPGYLKERCDFFIRRPCLLRNPRDVQKKTLETGNSIMAPMGNLKENSFTRDFERQ